MLFSGIKILQWQVNLPRLKSSDLRVHNCLAQAVQYLQSQLEELANEHELQIQEHEKITARLNESINR